MSIKTVQQILCDAPRCGDRTIEKEWIYVNAMVYGSVFHRLCWEKMTGPELAKILGLDDIKWSVGSYVTTKVIYDASPENQLTENVEGDW